MKEKMDRCINLLNRSFFLLPLFLLIGIGENAFFLFFSLAYFTILSGYISMLNLKLPKKERVQFNFSYSIFDMHPYVTFFTFLMFDTLIVIHLLFKYEILVTRWM